MRGAGCSPFVVRPTGAGRMRADVCGRRWRAYRCCGALGQRNFTLLWTGQTISRLGDYLYEIALAWWVLQKTGSPLAVAGVLVFTLTPMLVFLLIGGVAGDRFSRPPADDLLDLARGVIVGLVAILAYSDRLEVWQIYLASLLFGLVDAFFNRPTLPWSPTWSRTRTSERQRPLQSEHPVRRIRRPGYRRGPGRTVRVGYRLRP